ncbi:PIN domain-like protein [Macrolepiota fuliginosa MF-IS2]|uniref:PIN domain-like protein n=1 Tax=Macrolepiota fuliginosa MF-IS2 TaxID=1400762 RepID=A0A9P5XBN0_9AGAR|nr:PIN domain-like protein [Macrolepiota fuliginosa MF-IS2]
MGVLGLTPFLQKTCPQIIHKLPNRLKDLTGKKLVIDGTLITQRLHYAPSPHPFRHVLGWYSLAKEMNDNSVSAVCIFDGQQRSQAKARELGRRREHRRIDVSRGTLELSRTKRLQKLKVAMSGLHSLDNKDKSTIGEMLSRLSPAGGGTIGSLDGLNRVVERLQVLKGAPLPLEQEGVPLLAEPKEETLPVGSKEVPLPAEPKPKKERLLDRDPQSVVRLVQPQDSDFMGSGTHGPGHDAPSVVEDLKTVLLGSYRDFRSSVSKVACLPLPDQVQSSAIQVPSDESDPQEDLVLTKTQHELTQEEGKIWDELMLATSSLPPSSAPTSSLVVDNFVLSAAEDRLHALTSKSEIMAESYQRRMCVPTKSTYLESREILEAMGVPCYEIEGVHEGEALASSLVLRGLADYVVSEDSDVLVYEAPLIRNFSNRIGSLVLIHGNDVRAALDLSRDAYVDFAILLGTDFSQRIKNVGPSRAHKFIKEYGTIENIINSQTRFQPELSHVEYLAQVDSARAIFRSLPPIPDQLRVSLMSEPIEVDQAKVAVIMERCGLGNALMVDTFWDHEAALSGNYFSDDPSTIVE